MANSFVAGAVLGAALASLPAPLAGQRKPYETPLADPAAAVRERVPPELHDRLIVPFEVDPALAESIDRRVQKSGSEKTRRDAILDFIFGHLELRYSLQPTRNAAQTFARREGNCLSFVNLFVGIARARRLNPFYVEVQDYQRWNYQQGVVVSRGHIVAGLRVDGRLATYDFLPYQAKSYRDFNPITDLQAMAHYYNNLGAEALMAEHDDEAYDWLRIAIALAPDFDKAINNLGVALLRRGRTGEAVGLLERGVGYYPDNVPLLTNTARALQQAGQPERAEELLARLDQVNQANPFFYVYRGDMALARGDQDAALEFMRRAYRQDDDLPEVHIGLVRVYLALGRIEEARHHVERALRLDATHPEARKYAALIEARGSP